MVNLVEKIVSIEKKVGKLILAKNNLEEKNLQQEKLLREYSNKIKELETRLEEAEERNQSLKTANALLGSKDFKRETKLKINTLIREIDRCIVQLSD